MMSILLATAAILAGTWAGFPTLTPIVVGLVMGAIVPFAARRAALAGVLAWGGVLLAGALRGDRIGTLGTTLGGAVGVPSPVLFLVTLLYPAILAASAAWVSSLVVRRSGVSIAARKDLARDIPHN
jgi:hypothetical protein